MTLLVNEPNDFRVAVANALEAICPCRDYSYSIDGTGVVLVGATPVNCSCYCKHQAGCDLIRGVREGSSERYTIDTTKGWSEYDAGLNTVYWATDWSGPAADGVGQPIPPSVMLAHELTHAWLEVMGKNAANEGCAVRGENRIREEMCLPARKTYSGKIPDPCNDSVLAPDDSICNCVANKGGICQTLSLMRCKWRIMVVAVKMMIMNAVNPPAQAEPGAPGPFHEYMRQSQDPLDVQYRRAMAVRDRAPHRAELDAIERRLDDPSIVLRLESVGVVGGFWCVLIAEENDGLTLITDLRLDDVPRGPFAGGPGDLVEYRLSDPAIVSTTRSRIAQLQFPDGYGGNDQRFDGSVQFLFTRTPSHVHHAALYGYSYPAIHGSWRRPSGQNEARWDAIVAAYEIWRDLMRAAGSPLRVVARRSE